MSSLNSSKIKTSKNLKSTKNESKEAEDILKKGVENIYQSFNLIHKNYKEQISNLEKNVNNLSEKLETLKREIEMIQRENKYYKEKNQKLKNEITKMNKIVNKIKGKLTDEEKINEIIKCDSLKNFNLTKFDNKNNNKFKNNGLYLYNNHNNMKKNEKNKMIHFDIDAYDNNNDGSYEKIINEDNNYYIKNKNYINGKNDSFEELQLDINNNKYSEDQRKYRFPEQFPYKYRTTCISKEDIIKKKNNYMDKSEEDLPRDSPNFKSKTNKNRSYSSNKYIDEKKENKKVIEDCEINNDDLNVKKINNIFNNYTNANNCNKNKKKLEHKICLTYDNLFNNKAKEIKKKKYPCNTFRGKIFNQNSFENKKKDEITFFLNKCNIILDKEAADKVVKIFHEYKEGLITDKGLTLNIHKYIGNFNELIELFNKIFIKLL